MAEADSKRGTAPSEYELDPLYRSSRREAGVVLIVFAVFAVFVLLVSYQLGYPPEGQDTARVTVRFGVPTWVFWGIVLPWLAANVVTAWFCFFYMKQEPLDDSEDQAGQDRA